MKLRKMIQNFFINNVNEILENGMKSFIINKINKIQQNCTKFSHQQSK
jgi:hypothetical protein